MTKDSHGRHHDAKGHYMSNDDTAIIPEIIEPGTELEPRQPVQLSIIEDEPELMRMLFEEAVNSRMLNQMAGHLRMVEILYPEMAKPVGRTIAFDWPVCPTYSELDEWPVYT